MSTSPQHVAVDESSRRVVARLAPVIVAVVLTVLAGVATASALPEVTVRSLSFATMIAAVASGVLAVRRGPAWVRAVSAIVAVVTLMLGSTFFGLTYS